MTEIEVLVKFLLIDPVLVSDLKEFFKLFDEVVIVGRFLEFQGQIIKSFTGGLGKRMSTIHNTQQRYFAKNKEEFKSRSQCHT